jgi:hypothetical protein
MVAETQNHCQFDGETRTGSIDRSKKVRRRAYAARLPFILSLLDGELNFSDRIR